MLLLRGRGKNRESCRRGDTPSCFASDASDASHVYRALHFSSESIEVQALMP
jgi:hypothetical protein